MAAIVPRKKALSVSPLKVSQPVGAALVFLGLRGAMPLMHGSQGCTAFAKVFFVRHFREPIPLQTTAMDQVSAVMGADDSIVEALATICGKSQPEVIGLVSTGLSEAQGCDLHGAVRAFRKRCPEHDGTRVIAVNTPDFAGCFETGYAAALHALLEQMLPTESAGPTDGSRVLNVLPSSMLTPGDLEEIEELAQDFGFACRIVPNLGESLGGELTDRDFSPTTIGGTPAASVLELGSAAASVVIGPSLRKSGELIEKRTGLRTYQLPHLHDLGAVDAFVSVLLELSGQTAPSPRILRQRRQLTDAMLDTHFSLGQRKVAIATDGDLLLALTALAQSMGMEVVAAVTPSRAEALAQVPLNEVKIGDLEDLEALGRAAGAELLLANSHAAETALRMSLPLVRVGFPLFDLVGGYARRWVGYRGIRQTLFDLANTIHREALDEVPAYHARWSQKGAESAEPAREAAKRTDCHVPSARTPGDWI